MTDDRRQVIAALAPTADAVSGPCSRCGRRCWLSPAAARLVLGGDAVAVCTDCAGPDEGRAATIEPR